MNAFHPDFVKTHMPEFMSAFRSNAARVESGKKHGAKANRQSVAGGASSLSTFPKTERARKK